MHPRRLRPALRWRPGDLDAYNPYNGYLRGAANVTTANANYHLTTQKARQEREKANQAHLRTRHTIAEEAEWERGRIPNPEKVRDNESVSSFS